MTKTRASPILHLIRRVVEDQRLKELPDQELLRRFSAGRDEGAFSALLRRHGAMVLDICRNMLGNEADAEDAFQATFLVLAQRAGAIRNKSSVGSWLHGVAYRTALKAQAEFARRQKHEAGGPAQTVAAPSDDLAWREVQQTLHAELNRLSECYQAPLVLCYLEGKTQDEAALLLGVSRATVKKRLESARALLRQRLVRRGLGPAAVLAIAAWPAASVSAAVSSVLMDSTVKAATSVAAGGAAAAVFSAKVAALTQGVLRTMFLSKLKATAVGLLVAPLFVVGVLIPGLCALPQSSPALQPAVKPQKQPPDKQPKAEPATQQDAVNVMKPGADFVRSLAYCNEGKTVALVLWKEADVRTPGSVVLWDVQKGQVVHTLQKFDKDTPGQFFNVTSSKDGTTIAVSTDKRGKIDYGAIKVWEARTAKLLSTVELSGQVRGIALSPDGKKVVGGAGVPHDGKMFVWDVKTGDIVQTLEAEGMRYFGAAISEDGKWIAGAGDENGKGKVVVWEVETGKVKHEWTDLAIMSVVAFSPDSRLVAASGPNEKAIRVWDVQTGKLKHHLKPEGDHEINTGLAFSPNGQMLATVGRKDARVSLWDLTKENARVTLEGHGANVLCVAFSPDGRMLASGGDDGTLRFWPVAPAKQPKK